MSPELIIPVFAWINLPMLGWLAAAAAPILIHLWSRQKYREMPWAAMEYLLAALRRQTRRMRFEQLLLLIIRTLLIVLLVVAVAEPVLKRTGFAFTPGVRTHRVLVLDGSFSMAFKPGEQTLFDRARDIARRIVEDSPQGDAFTLVLMSSPPQVVVGNPVFDDGDFLQEINAIRLPHTTADLPATLAQVETILTAARREHPRLAREEIYFLSDLQRADWLPEDRSTAAAAEMRKRAQRLAESAALVVIDLGQEDAENQAVTGARTRTFEPFATVGRRIDIETDLKNFGPRQLADQSVELWVDGRRAQQERVALGPGGAASALFAHRFETPGDHTLEIRIQGDRLSVDNQRFVVVPVKERIRVLCVNGRPSGDPRLEATYHLVPALSPWQNGAEGVWIQPEVVTESALLERDLSPYDCVFLCNVAQFTASEAKVLDGYLRAGGSLVFFLGDQVLADRYNRELAGQQADAIRLLPARLGNVVTTNQFGLDPLEYKHPIAAEFRDHEGAGLLTTPVQKYFELTLPEDTATRTAVALANGDPLIVERSVHRGRVVLVATSADLSWSSMPKWHSYPAIIQEILAFAVAGQLRQRNLQVGQPLEGTVASPTGDVPLRIQVPDGRSVALPLDVQGDYSTWNYGDTMASGVYTAEFGPPLNSSQSFAVNVDTSQSDLTHLTSDQLRDDVWSDVPFDHQTSWQNIERQPTSPIRASGLLSVWLLYAVLGLLFLETYLAWRFGHHGT